VKGLLLSVLVPVYNNPGAPALLLERLEPVLESLGFRWHVLFIDDGSTDGTRAVLEDLAGTHPGTGWASLSRNGGQQRALAAGLDLLRHRFPGESTGWVVTMDDDLDHPPELIPRMLSRLGALGEGLLFAVPRIGGSSPGRRLRDRFFCRYLGKPEDLRIGSFRIFRWELLAELPEEPHPFPYISALLLNLAALRGVRAGHLEFDPHGFAGTAGTAASEGRSSRASRYGLSGRIRLFWNLWRHYRPRRRPAAVPEGSSDIPVAATGGYPFGFRLHILGGGPGQIGAILRAREMGLETVVSDRNPEAPGLALADFSAPGSTFDPEAVREDARTRRSSALLATGTDQPVLTAALVSRDLDLPYFLSPRQAALVTNKREMKRGFLEAGIPTSPFRILREDFASRELSELRFPLVIKPLDSQGQRGVYRMETEGEIRRVFREVLSHSREQEVIVEEYYPSREITVSGWAEEGELLALTTTDRVTLDNPPHIGVCLAHHWPSRFAGREPEIRELTGRIIRAFGIRTGPVYFQYLVGAEGIRVNETACRIGGAYEDRFIPWITGTDILDVMIRKTCGRPYRLPSQEEVDSGSRGKAFSLQMFFCRPGILSRQSGMEEARDLPGVLGGEFLLTPGTRIREKTDSTQRAGYFMVTGSCPEEVNRRTEAVWGLLRAEDPQGENLIMRHGIMMMPGEEL